MAQADADALKKAFKGIGCDKKAVVDITVNRTNKGTYFLVPPEYEEPDKVYTLKKSKLGYLDAYGGVAIKKKI